MPHYDDLRIEMIGAGAPGTSLLEQAEEALQRIAQQVCDPETEEKAKMTITLQVERVEGSDNRVLVGGSIKVAPPKTVPQEVSGVVRKDGRLETASTEHRQLPLAEGIEGVDSVEVESTSSAGRRSKAVLGAADPNNGLN